MYLDHINTEILNSEENLNNAKSLLSELEFIFGKNGKRDLSPAVYATYLFTLLKHLENDYPFCSFDEVCEYTLSENEKLCYLFKMGNEDIWEEVNKLFKSYKIEAMVKAILLISSYSEESTPYSISKLACKILDMQDGDKLFELGCGGGSFISVVSESEKDFSYHGMDINSDAVAVADIVANIMGKNADVEVSNVFYSAAQDDYLDMPRKYNKIFANYPFGLKKKTGDIDSYISMKSETMPVLANSRTNEWVFNAAIVDLLRSDGKGIAIMPSGATWNTFDKEIRKYFIENGLIEAVIALPKKMFSYTFIETSMIILSHGNKNGVKLIDATHLYTEERRINTFSDEQIDTIVKLLNGETDASMVISLDELRDNDYSLNPIKYRSSDLVIDDAVMFSEVLSSISRAAQIKASELDALTTKEPTNIFYLMPSNIKDGNIVDMVNLKELDQKLEKYCLKDNDLVLTKNGSPYKAAVVHVPEGMTILANGNLYIIRLNPEKMLPYYLKGFLDSEKGKASLKNITVGTIIPNLGVDQLKKMRVPMPSIEIQEKYVDRYLEIKDRIQYLEYKLKAAKDELSGLFDEEVEE